MVEASGRPESTNSAPFPRPPRNWTVWFAPTAVVLALASATVTFFVLTGLTPVIPTHNVVVSVLLANAAIAVVLLAVIAWEFVGLVRARRRGRAGARLHSRIVLLFGIVAVVPAILVAIIASITLDRGLDRWFSDRTRVMLSNAINIADAYVRDYSLSAHADLAGIAGNLTRMKPMFDENREEFRKFFTANAAVRGMPAAMLIHGDLSLIERAEINIGREFLIPTNLNVRAATQEQPILALAASGDYFHAVVPSRRIRRYVPLCGSPDRSPRRAVLASNGGKRR